VAVFFDLVLPILSGISIIGVFFFLFRAISARSRMSHQAYEVGRVETRQKAQVNVLRAGFALVLALIFLALIAMGPTMETMFTPEPTATPTATAVPPTIVPTATATSTEVPGTPVPTATSPVPTATATVPPTSTITPEPPTAAVTSGVGVYLRGAAGTGAAELEYLPDGTLLFILEGVEVADDLLWQQVQTESGLVGWVALDFITLNQP
jgi:hypothetical protein